MLKGVLEYHLKSVLRVIIFFFSNIVKFNFKCIYEYVYGYKLVSNKYKISILKSKFAASTQTKESQKNQSHNTNKYSI